MENQKKSYRRQNDGALKKTGKLRSSDMMAAFNFESLLQR